jgi:putative ABC transport system permease protein
MNPFILVRVAFRSITQHSLRSLLTMLGIIIGVGAIIAVRSIGEGAKLKVAEQIQRLGSNFIIVLAGSEKNRFGAPRGGTGLLTLKKSDYAAIVRECKDIFAASPGVGTSVTAVYEGANWQTTMIGVSDEYQDIRSWPMLAGTFLSKENLNAGSRVVVLGLTVARELFKNMAPTDIITRRIRINKIPFTVIGIFAEKGKRPDGRDEDDMIFAPWTTVHRKIMGITDGFSAIIISAKSREVTGRAAREIRAVLRQQHELRPKDEDDFTLFTQDEIARASDAANAALNILLLVIASISLIVGGVGIMNIMLVTVTERTREIGIRLALGASTTVILVQFILEAVTICCAGGGIGVTIGMLMAQAVGHFLKWKVVVLPSSIMMGLTSSILVGLFFGYYPAYKASQLNPVEALAER